MTPFSKLSHIHNIVFCRMTSQTYPMDLVWVCQQRVPPLFQMQSMEIQYQQTSLHCLSLSQVLKYWSYKWSYSKLVMTKYAFLTWLLSIMVPHMSKFLWVISYINDSNRTSNGEETDTLVAGLVTNFNLALTYSNLAEDDAFSAELEVMFPAAYLGLIRLEPTNVRKWLHHFSIFTLKC